MEDELPKIIKTSESSKKNDFHLKMQNIFRDNIEVYERKENIINKDNQNNSSSNHKITLKQEKFNAKKKVNQNHINAKMNIDYNKEQTYVNFFSHKYDLNNVEAEKKFNDKIESMIYISHRTNFPKLTVKNKYGNNLTSDCEWGSMIRASQMILARALYKLFRKQYNTTKNALRHYTLVYFLEYPFNFMEMPNKFSSIISKFLSDMYSDIIPSSNNEEPNNSINNNNNSSDNSNNHIIHNKAIVYDIISIRPPFSIHNICSVGELYNKIPGQYYNDIQLPHIFKSINKHFNAISNLAILSFQTLIDKSLIIKKCFTETPSDDIPSASPIMSNSNRHNYNHTIDMDYALGKAIRFLDKKYYFDKAGLIFVSIRIGLNGIFEKYFTSIKKIFDCNQFIGFVGSKDDDAYYFFGYGQNHLYYLDPKVTQESVQTINENSYDSYQPKKIYQVKFEKLKPALTLAFLFRDVEEFNSLFQWIDEVKNGEYSCFTVIDKVNVKNNIINAEIDNDINDF